MPDWAWGVEREEPRKRVKGSTDPSGVILDVTSSRKPSLTTPATMRVRGPCLELPLPQRLAWVSILASLSRLWPHEVGSQSVCFTAASQVLAWRQVSS